MGDYGEVWYELKEASVGGHYYYLMWSNQPRRTNLRKIGVNLAFEFVVVANWPRKNRKNSALSFHEFFPLNKKKRNKKNLTYCVLHGGRRRLPLKMNVIIHSSYWIGWQ